MPVVIDPKEYGDHWNAWWWSMQSGLRDPESPFNMTIEESGSWSHMLCGRPNVLLLVILALAWWVKYGSGTNLSRSANEEAVKDVTWVLTQLRLALDDHSKARRESLRMNLTVIILSKGI